MLHNKSEATTRGMTNYCPNGDEYGQERRLARQPENEPQAPTERQQQTVRAHRWWPVYMVTLLYVALVILLLDCLTRYFSPMSVHP
ncbi:MAG: hypothetical protein ACUVR8_07490 [Acidobacteriota bacterium]